MEKKFNLVLDAKRTGFNTIRGLKQGDNNSVLNITLVQNGVPFELTGLTVRINYKRPDSKIFLQMADITNSTEGKIKINVLTQVLENVGEVKADLSIFDSNNRKITSVTFSMFVDGSIYRNDYIEPEDLDLIQSIWVEEDKRIKQEKDRQKNESDRQAAESLRQKTFEDNEVERKKVFEFTEGERIKSEKDRQINEENRQEREITRENNEEIRVSTENRRVMAELLRKENEDKRKKNEVVREKNETIRKSEFDGIKKEFGDLKNTATDENAVLKIDNQLQDLKEIIKSYTYDGSLGSEIYTDKIITPDMETLEELLNDICKDIESIKKDGITLEEIKTKTDEKIADITTEQENIKVDINNIIDKNTPSIPNDSCIYYYVDNESGKDDNDGTSLSTAFKTLEKAWSKIPYLFCNNYKIEIIGNYNSLVTLNSKKSMCGNRIVISPNSSNIVCKFTNGIRINDFSGGVHDALLLFKINFGNTIRICGSRGVEVSDCILNFDKPGTGLYVETSTIYAVSNTFSSNINTCIFGYYLSYIYSVNNKGKGNFGLKASSGSTIRKYKEQPKGTTSNELTEMGGEIE